MAAKKEWIDHNGITIPSNRITKLEKEREAAASRIAKKAQAVSQALSDLKDEMKYATAYILSQIVDQEGLERARPRKGNITWYNFDRSIKVECDIDDRITFDDMMIMAAKEKFDTFLNENTGSATEIIRSLVLDAFSTSKGRLDAKKLTALSSYRVRISKEEAPLFHEALDLIDKGTIKAGTATYYKVSLRQDDGKYKAIPLSITQF